MVLLLLLLLLLLLQLRARIAALACGDALVWRSCRRWLPARTEPLTIRTLFTIGLK